MRKASITPFCALSLMLVASLVLALLESARFYGLNRYVSMKADAAIDSVCAEYQPFLWQQYGLLFLDGTYGTGTFSTEYALERMEYYMERNRVKENWFTDWFGLDLFQLKKEEVLLEGYALAADDAGELFLNYIAQRTKEEMPIGIAEELLLQYQKTMSLEAEYGSVEDLVKEAQDTVVQEKTEWIERSKEEDASMSGGRQSGDKEMENFLDTTVIDNVLNMVQQLRSESTIQMIFGGKADVGALAYSMEESMQKRKKEEGTMQLKGESDWYRKLLVLNYLESYFSNYKNSKEGRLLRCEMEYVVCGADTEEKNLAGVLERMLLLREAANLAHIFANENKMEQIETVAGAIGVLSGGDYAVVKIVELGLAAVWAYAESVLDVRALVQGDVIPLIKQETEWTLEFGEMFRVYDTSVKAKMCSVGLCYTDYLKQLLFFMPDQDLAYRMLEIMELGLQSRTEFKNCRMDYMLVMLRFKTKWKSVPVFSELITIGDMYQEKYIFSKEIERSYIP